MKTRTKRAQHTRATRSLVRSKEEEEEEEDVNLISNHYIVIWLTIHRFSSNDDNDDAHLPNKNRTSTRVAPFIHKRTRVITLPSSSSSSSSIHRATASSVSNRRDMTHDVTLSLVVRWWQSTNQLDVIRHTSIARTQFVFESAQLIFSFLSFLYHKS